MGQRLHELGKILALAGLWAVAMWFIGKIGKFGSR